MLEGNPEKIFEKIEEIEKSAKKDINEFFEREFEKWKEKMQRKHENKIHHLKKYYKIIIEQNKRNLKEELKAHMKYAVYSIKLRTFEEIWKEEIEKIKWGGFIKRIIEKTEGMFKIEKILADKKLVKYIPRRYKTEIMPEEGIIIKGKKIEMDGRLSKIKEIMRKDILRRMEEWMEK